MNEHIGKIQNLTLKFLTKHYFFLYLSNMLKKVNIDENSWVSHLIPLLPTEVAKLALKEPEENRERLSTYETNVTAEI